MKNTVPVARKIPPLFHSIGKVSSCGLANLPVPSVYGGEDSHQGVDSSFGKFTGKERDSETGLYYYGARYLDGKTSRWLSADPALGDYVPGAPVNDEARKRNGNLLGMGGVFNTVNFHLYHYAGNNPVKYVDPDGNFMGLKGAASNFKSAFGDTMRKLGRSGNFNTQDALVSTTQNEKSNVGTTIFTDSRRSAIIEFEMGTNEEIQSYIENEKTRYEEFSKIRGKDILQYGVANDVLDAAESRYKRAESEALHDRKSKINAKIYAENEANKMIDDFIGNHNPDYVPPNPLDER